MPTKKKNLEQKCVCITLWTRHKFTIPTPEICDQKKITWIHIGSEELTTENKQRHYHAVCKAKERHTKKWWKNIFNQECHVESTKCRDKQRCIDYADKNEAWQNRNEGKPTTKIDGHKPFFMFGTPPRQGKRTDVLKLRDHYKDQNGHRDGLMDDEVAPLILRMPRAAAMCKQYLTEPRDINGPATELHIYWTDDATKDHEMQRHVFNEALKHGLVYSKPPGRWWNGYEQEHSVIINDFPNGMSANMLTYLISSIPFQVDVKNGMEQFTSKKVYLISYVDPDWWWRNDQFNYPTRHYESFMENVTSITCYATKLKPIPECDSDDPFSNPQKLNV